MSLISTGELGMFRGLAKSMMIDTCDIRAVSTTVFDPVAGITTDVPGELLYQGKCKRQLKVGGLAEERAEAGAFSFTEARYSLHLPLSSPRIPIGSMVTMTDCPNDEFGVGQRLRVFGPHAKTWASARRINVVEVVE